MKAVRALLKSRPVGTIIGAAFEFAPGCVPLRRVLETDAAICVRHPFPIAREHLLVVPKRRIPTLYDAVRDHHEILLATLELARHFLGPRSKLARNPLNLYCNFGKRQDIKQLHFHLISDDYLPAAYREHSEFYVLHRDEQNAVLQEDRPLLGNLNKFRIANTRATSLRPENWPQQFLDDVRFTYSALDRGELSRHGASFLTLLSNRVVHLTPTEAATDVLLGAA